MIILNANFLNDLLPAASVDKSRPYINGVFVEDVNGKRIYTATNGHVLLRQVGDIWADSDPLPEGGILLKLPRKIKTLKNEMVNFMIKLIDGEEQGQIFGAKDNMLFDILKVKVPNLENIIDDTHFHIQRNAWIPCAPRYLELICRFFGNVALESPLTNNDDLLYESCAMKWEKKDYKGNLEKLAILMPVRI